jgi:hypothetical protein
MSGEEDGELQPGTDSIVAGNVCYPFRFGTGAQVEVVGAENGFSFNPCPPGG